MSSKRKCASCGKEFVGKTNYKYCAKCYIDDDQIFVARMKEIDAMLQKFREEKAIKNELNFAENSNNTDKNLQHTTNDNLSFKIESTKKTTTELTKEQISSQICRTYLKKIRYVI